MKNYNRRRFMGWLLAVGAGWYSTRRTAAASFEPSNEPSKHLRYYRADAVILVLGLPIYRRTGVGSGQASMEETAGDASKSVTLNFAASSDPQRAHGLSRLGWIREVVQHSSASPKEASYFGVLTSSPEESLEHARKSLAKPENGRSLFSAVTGQHTTGRSRSAITHFEFPANTNWSDRQLIGQAQSTFQSNAEWRETAWPDCPASAPSTFLFELSQLLERRAPKAAGRYVYNEREYRLELEALPGGGPGGLQMVRGKIRNLNSGHQTPFQLWIEAAPGPVLPVRIEYQPRSFLRLCFEAVPEKQS
jgi:hypothetical protein